jgi:hypothetical protein
MSEKKGMLFKAGVGCVKRWNYAMLHRYQKDAPALVQNHKNKRSSV